MHQTSLLSRFGLKKWRQELVAPWRPSTVLPFACDRLGSIRLQVTISSCSGAAANMAAIDKMNPKANNRRSGAIELLPVL
jgi:hypothetical protein